jgi:hypothetical protein
MKYIDCTLTIKDNEKVSFRTGLYPPIHGKLRPDELTRMTVDRLNEWVKRESDYTGEDLRLLGLHLYEFLFSDEKVRKAFAKTYVTFGQSYQDEQQQLGESDLRLRFKLVFSRAAQDVAQWPWELTYVPLPDIASGAFLSGERSELILTRFVPEVEQFKNLKPQTQPLKIFFVYAQPDGMDKLDEQEIKDLRMTLEDLERSGRVITTTLPNPTSKKLIAELEKGEPHILHIIAHGEAGRLALIMDKNDKKYDFKQGGLQPEWIDSKGFRAIFGEKYRPRLVFLDACYGAAYTAQTATSVESFKNLARELAYAEVPAVIAMQYKIFNIDAGVFASHFYKAIGQGKEIDEAVRTGRYELCRLKPAWGHRRFGTPVVYLQSNKAIVVPSAQETSQLQQKKCDWDDCETLFNLDYRGICKCPYRRPVFQPPLGNQSQEGSRTVPISDPNSII